MRKFLMISAICALAALLVAPTMAAEHGEKSVNSYGEVRARAEVLQNYLSLDDNDNFDNLSFGVWRADIGLEAELDDNVVGVIELQGFGVWGLGQPDSVIGDPLGQTVSFPDEDDEIDVNVHQAFVDLRNLGGSDLHLRVGRANHQVGNELMIGNDDFYNGTSYDGVRLWHDGDGYRPEVFFYIIDEEDVDEDRNNSGDPDPSGGDDDVTLWGIDVDIALGDDGQHVQPYLLYYRDGDYTGSGGKLWTFGAQYGRPAPKSVSAFTLDWSIEAAIQSGDFSPNGAMLDFGGSIVEGWVGFNLPHASGNSHSRIDVGALIASGDDNLSDSDLDAFMPLFPDDHAYGRGGDLDLFASAGSLGGWFGSGSNNIVQLFSAGFGLAGNSGLSNVTDFFVGYKYHGQRHGFSAKLHSLSLTEDAIHQLVFGTTDDDIGLETDLVYDFMYSKNVGIQIGAAQLSVGDFYEQLFGPSIDDITRVYGQIAVAWD